MESLLSLGLLISLFMFIYFLLKHIRENKAIKKTINNLLDSAKETYEKRKEENEKAFIEDGYKEKEEFFFNLDLMIERSGLRKNLNFLTTEVYIAIIVILFFIIFMLFSSFNFILGALAGMVVIVCGYGLIYVLANVNNEKIEAEMTKLANLIENYAGTDSDIVNILGNVYPYLNGPLREYIECFYNEANISGDYERAFLNLENKIQSQKLKALIRNLEICSRYEANYDVIIKDERRSIRNYSKAKEKMKAIIKNGRTDIIFSLLMSLVLVGMFSSFAPNMLSSLVNSSIGNAILLYCIFVLGMCLWNFISFDKEV